MKKCAKTQLSLTIGRCGRRPLAPTIIIIIISPLESIAGHRPLQLLAILLDLRLLASSFTAPAATTPTGVYFLLINDRGIQRFKTGLILI
jgi:hypothetical protein